MLMDRLKALIEGGAPERPVPREPDDVQLAAAALLVDAACLDGRMETSERTTILRLLRDRFSLDDDEADDLLRQAEEVEGESTELYGFTKVLKDHFSFEERIRIIEMLWEVAYADGALHDFEASLMRRVCGLLYVSDRDSGLARQRVLERLGQAARPS
jgi:uncharacterized tellurite resistance protein B-like protein